MCNLRSQKKKYTFEIENKIVSSGDYSLDGDEWIVRWLPFNENANDEGGNGRIGEWIFIVKMAM